MRILHLTAHLNTGGITTYLYNLSRGLMERGHEVFITSSGGSRQRDFECLGVQHRRIPLKIKSELHPRLWFEVLPALRRLVREDKIEILHAHKRVTQVLCQVISRLDHVPYVSTCHGLYLIRLGRRIFPAWGDKVIAISDFVASYLTDNARIPQSRVVTVFNALAPRAEDRFSPAERVVLRKAYGLKQDSIVVGGAGRFVKVKGMEELLYSAQILSNFHADVQFLIVGDGRDREKLMDLKNELLLDGQVSVLGDMKDLRPALETMDIFVAPVRWEEGFGYSVLEAMAQGKPVVASKTGALPCLVEDGVTGYLIPPGDRDALMRKIDDLISAPEKRQRMGEAARQRAKTCFSWESMIGKTESVYDEVVVKPKGVAHGINRNNAKGN